MRPLNTFTIDLPGTPPPPAHCLEFEPLAHEYRLDGIVVPSVTSILRSVNLIDFSRVPSGILLDAQARGTRVHRAVHFLAEGDLDWASVLDEDRGYVESAAAYLETIAGRARSCEVRVYHPDFKYGGTFDLLVAPEGGGGVWDLADFKTGDPRDVCAWLQLAGYDGALRAMPDRLVPFGAPVRRVSVALKRDGSFPTLDVYTDPQDWPKFLAALTIANEITSRRAR